MTATLFAATAAGLWVLCTIVVNAALRGLPSEDRMLHVLAGVCLSCAAGAACTAPFALPQLIAERRVSIGIVEGIEAQTLATEAGSDRTETHPAALQFQQVLILGLAGILMFPIGTGAYYASAVVFGSRSEYAAQFGKIKPILSVTLAVLLLGDRLEMGTIAAAAFMSTGIVILIRGGLRGSFHPGAVAWGVSAALSWSVAEVLVKVGEARSGLVSNFCGLTVGLGFGLLAVLVVRLWTGGRLRTGAWIRFFALHGVISFGGAYACFYESIRLQGVSRTALTTACWPVIALGVNQLWLRWHKRAEPIPGPLLIASLLLLTGSLIQILTNSH